MPRRRRRRRRHSYAGVRISTRGIRPYAGLRCSTVLLAMIGTAAAAAYAVHGLI